MDIQFIYLTKVHYRQEQQIFLFVSCQLQAYSADRTLDSAHRRLLTQRSPQQPTFYVNHSICVKLWSTKLILVSQLYYNFFDRTSIMSGNKSLLKKTIEEYGYIPAHVLL